MRFLCISKKKTITVFYRIFLCLCKQRLFRIVSRILHRGKCPFPYRAAVQMQCLVEDDTNRKHYFTRTEHY